MSERDARRRHQSQIPRGYFAIGIVGGKTPENLGTLWRSASLYGAAFTFTVGKRYETVQPSDTMRSQAHTPLFHFADVHDLVHHLPRGCPLVGVELATESVPLRRFGHPLRACYLLGAEDYGLRPKDAGLCHRLVQIESVMPWSMNVASAGAVLLYDRFAKDLTRADHLEAFRAPLEVASA